MLGLSATLAGFAGPAEAAVPGYWWYMGLRVLSGMAASGMTLAAKALATEPIGRTWRGMAGVVTCWFSVLAGLITVLISSLASHLTSWCAHSPACRSADIVFLLHVRHVGLSLDAFHDWSGHSSHATRTC